MTGSTWRREDGQLDGGDTVGFDAEGCSEVMEEVDCEVISEKDDVVDEVITSEMEGVEGLEGGCVEEIDGIEGFEGMEGPKIASETEGLEGVEGL
jgi:hypothetical protein